ncbi:hypothetical protein MBLNU230_g3113t1 [Neophaeotheca triangularis]
MSTLVWPPTDPQTLIAEEDATIARELTWLLTSLQETLQALKAGLEDCAKLLAPQEPGSTLVLSSLRSESLKGFVTRIGTRVVKGDIHLRLPSLPPQQKGQSSYKLSISNQSTAPTIVLEQLTTARTLINACLDVVDATRWTGDSQDAGFICGQLKLLHENIQEAKGALKGWTPGQKEWWEEAADEAAFDPPLPPNVSFHLSVSEAAVLLNVRTLEAAGAGAGATTPLGAGTASSYSGFSLRERFASALGGGRQPVHEEADEVFVWKGREVRVKEKVRVESQDPSLMAAMAKLGALERNVSVSRRALDVVMGREVEET